MKLYLGYNGTRPQNSTLFFATELKTLVTIQATQEILLKTLQSVIQHTHT